jgi:hypothetical protein
MSANLRAVARVGRVDCRKAQQVCRQQLEEDAKTQWLAQQQKNGVQGASEWREDDQGFKDMRIQEMLPHFRVYIGQERPQLMKTSRRGKTKKQKGEGGEGDEDDDEEEEVFEGEEGGGDDEEEKSKGDGEGSGEGGSAGAPKRKRKVTSKSMLPRAFESDSEMHQSLQVMEKVIP